VVHRPATQHQFDISSPCSLPANRGPEGTDPQAAIPEKPTHCLKNGAKPTRVHAAGLRSPGSLRDFRRHWQASAGRGVLTAAVRLLKLAPAPANEHTSLDLDDLLGGSSRSDRCSRTRRGGGHRCVLRTKPDRALQQKPSDFIGSIHAGHERRPKIPRTYREDLSQD